MQESYGSAVKSKAAFSKSLVNHFALTGTELPQYEEEKEFYYIPPLLVYLS